MSPVRSAMPPGAEGVWQLSRRASSVVRLLLLAACAGSLVCPWVASAAPAAGPRIALVIANANYADPSDRLTGALADGRTIKTALSQIGFTVTEVKNADLEAMTSAVQSFKRDLVAAGPAAIGFFYFAGHGTADRERKDNYLLPVDIESIDAPDASDKGLSVGSITDILGRSNEQPAIAIVIDACRVTVPGPQRGGDRKDASTRPAGGLVNPAEPTSRGLLVAQSASDGQTASDEGDYANALAEKLTAEGLTLDQVFEQVRQQIGKSRGQLPVSRSSVVDKICLVSCDSGPRIDALALLRAAVDERAAGDAGQIGAMEQMTREGKSFAGMDLKGLYLRSARLDNADLSLAELQGADLSKAALTGAKLRQANLAFATLTGAGLTRAEADSALLFFATGDGADFSGLKAERSNWRGASLRNAKFRDARLGAASFMFADLRGADFSGADLRGAFLIGSLLDGARFEGAVLDNTDLSGAVGDAGIFGKGKPSGLCGNGGGILFRVELFRVSDNARYDGGKQYESIYPSWGPIGSASGPKGIPTCARRTELPAGGTTVWHDGDQEHIGDQMSVRLDADLIDRAGREATYVKRLESMVRNSDAAVLSTRRMDFTDGADGRALLAALQRNDDKAKFALPLAVLDASALTMYELKYNVVAKTPDQWRRMARNWVWTETQEHSSPGARWPRFFPEQTEAGDIESEHVEVFKRWTLDRARAFPAKAVLELQIGQTLAWELRDAAKAGADPVIVRPLGTFIREDGGAPRFPAATAKLVDPGATYFWLRGGAWYDREAMVRLPGPAEQYQVRIPAGKIKAFAYQPLRMRMVLSVRGIQELPWEYGRSVAVIESELSDLSVVSAQDASP